MKVTLGTRFATFYQTFDLLSVFKQLREGWPTAMKLKKEMSEETARAYCVKILEEYMPGEENADMYAMGTTRVYLKEEGFNKLQLKITSILDRVTTVVQNHMRRYLQQKWYKGMKRWAILHQRLARGKVKRSWFKVALKEKKDEEVRIAEEEARLAAIAKAEEEERLRQEAIAKASKAEKPRPLASRLRRAQTSGGGSNQGGRGRERASKPAAAEEERLRLIEVEAAITIS